jgi:hypothetical protein
MKKRMLTIALFARLYFEEIRIVYDEADPLQREAADKRFRYLVKTGSLNNEVVNATKKRLFDGLEKEIDELKSIT